MLKSDRLLAGIVFAVEELGRRLETRTSGILVSTVILAGLVAIALLGNYNYLGHLKVGSEGGGFAIPILGSGLACGVLGGFFSRLLLWPQKRGDLALWRWRSAHPVLFAGACGILIAMMGWASGGLSYGSGYAITSEVVAGEKDLPWYAFAVRFLATVVSYYSGIPGGIVAPALAVGAALGFELAYLTGFDAIVIPVVALCMTGLGVTLTLTRPDMSLLARRFPGMRRRVDIVQRPSARRRQSDHSARGHES